MEGREDRAGADGTRIDGTWEISHDGTWQKDFDLIYTRRAAT